MYKVFYLINSKYIIEILIINILKTDTVKQITVYKKINATFLWTLWYWKTFHTNFNKMSQRISLTQLVQTLGFSGRIICTMYI